MAFACGWSAAPDRAFVEQITSEIGVRMNHDLISSALRLVVYSAHQ
jgi:hypothetical protein